MRDPAFQHEAIWPAAPSDRVIGAFGWWLRRMFRRSFAGVWAACGTATELRAADKHQGPAIVLMNHASWWDPLVGLMLARELTPRRRLLAPMELDQLKKFGFFRRLGVFGLDPDRSDALDAMVSYVRSRFEVDPRTAFWITPQGQFTDPRTPIRLRPGAASLAARSSTDVRVVCVAVEYAFWTDQKPEVFLRFAAVPAPESPTTAGWTRAMTHAMQANADALATLVTARDHAAFEPVLAARRGGVNPLYDAWLRLRGRSGRIDGVRRTPVPAPIRAGVRP
ncbi:MAG: lysophospholipid acyltransferase family protein [Phycisphaeraceae bacterium]|nr:lysophospholipid acyltransferase family protein [Phycisphaeraceae bacterium]